MLLLRKSTQWKFWPTHDSYLHFKKKFFSFFVISEIVSVLAAQDCFHWQFSIQHFCSICNSKSIKVTAICLLLHWQESGCEFPEFTNCSYTMRKHTLLLHDSNLTLSCHKFVFYHLNRDSGTSLCNTLIWLWFTGRNGILTFLCLLKTDW